MPYKDPEKQRDCKRRWRERNKEKANESARIAKTLDRNFRKGLLQAFPCVCCRELDPDLIQWHHVVPQDKSFGIIAGNSFNHEAWWSEVLKCIPVCANCHIKIHKNKLCLIPPKLR